MTEADIDMLSVAVMLTCSIFLGLSACVIMLARVWCLIREYGRRNTESSAKRHDPGVKS